MMYQGIESLVENLIEIPSDVVISTNGVLYKEVSPKAQVQISMWTLNSEKYSSITKGKRKGLEIVKSNIEKYIKNGNLTFLNMPLYERNVKDIEEVSDFAKFLNIPLVMRPIFPANGFYFDQKLPSEVKHKILELNLNGANIRYSNTTNEVPIQKYFQKNETL